MSYGKRMGVVKCSLYLHAYLDERVLAQLTHNEIHECFELSSPDFVHFKFTMNADIVIWMLSRQFILCRAYV